MRKWHWFQFVSYGTLILFFGIMFYVIGIAYTRRSGTTGLDMATLQKLRYEALPKQNILLKPQKQ